MRAVIQRVSEADVSVDGETIGAIGSGLVVLVGVATEDTERDAVALAAKLVGLRIFPDDDRKMNRSIVDVGGSMLLISQFTLLADLRKGRRPAFNEAASPEIAEPLLATLVRRHRGRRSRSGAGPVRGDDGRIADQRRPGHDRDRRRRRQGRVTV